MNGMAGASAGGDCELSGTLTWKKVADSGEFSPRDGHCACAAGGKTYIFGGVVQMGTEGEHLESNDLLIFDPVQETCKKITPSGNVPSPRSAATLVAVGSKLYLFGGLSNSIGWLNDLHIFDTESNVWMKAAMTGSAPSPRDKLTSAVVENKIYFFGGFGPKASSNGVDSDDDDEELSSEEDEEVSAVKSLQRAAQFGWFDDMFVFDTATSSWSQPMHMNTGGPSARAAHTMCAVDNQLIIFGGRDCASRTNDLYVYDTVSRMWLSGPIVCQQLEPRSFHAASVVGSRVVVTGGRGRQDQHFADCHVFDVGSKSWLKPKLAGDVIPARGSHCVTAVDDFLVLCGGSSDFNPSIGHCTKYYNDIYIAKTDVLL